MRVAMVVAEPSGDNIAADLIRKMNALHPSIEVSGICGPAMIEEGAQAIYSIDDISSLGVEGLLRRLRKILKIRKDYVNSLLVNPPDAFVGIDAPDFNLSIEERLRKAGIPTLQYVAPTVWAWRAYRIRKLRRAAEQVLTIYPYESALFDRVGIPYRYVGHPLADQIAARSGSANRAEFGFNDNDTVFAIMPGSRINEVSRLTSIFLLTAVKLSESLPNCKFIAPFANEETKGLFEEQLDRMNLELSIKTVINESLGAIEVADAVIAASGTAALEAALCGKPVVVSYRVSQLSYWMVRMLSRTSHYSMLNHFDGGPVIPEFMQNECTVENLTAETLRLMRDSDYRHRVLQRFEAISRQLKCNANHLAAHEIMRIAAQ